MRIGHLGLVGLAALAAACDKPPPEEPARFRVGGTVTGLSGNLTLQLNRQESLSREADGPFSFETRLEDRSDFAVTVATQPPEQDCSVEGGTGKVAGADVDSVRVRCAQRTYTIGGTVEGLRGTLALGLDGGEVLQVTQSGRFTFTTKRPKGGAYAVSVATLPEGQRCTVSNGSGTVEGNVEGISVRCLDWFELVSTQAAELVIGQEDFESNAEYQGKPAGDNNMSFPWGNPTLANGRLYITDRGSNRILGFNAVPTADNATAGFVLGQPDFSSTSYGSGKTRLDTPAGLSNDGTRLAVADSSNHRVLVYSTIPTRGDIEPELVIGQPSFDSTSSGCTRQSINFPGDVFIGHGKILVADTSNHRVLVWNSIPTSNDAQADLVLGQEDFTSCAANHTGGTGSTPSASTLSSPNGVWTDGTRLVVADSSNNRVLIWNQFPTRNGQAADVVLGQVNFSSKNAALGQTGMSTPSFVTSNGLQLFVVDHENSRVLVWDSIPTRLPDPTNPTDPATEEVKADHVLGQPDFNSANQYDPPTGRLPSARSTYLPGGVLLAWPYVIVSDSGNHRVLAFKSR